LNKLNEDPNVHGIIVQMPLPKHIDSKLICDLVDYKKDVDGFHVRNIGELAKRNGEPLFVPCTAAGVMKLLESAKINPKVTKKKFFFFCKKTRITKYSEFCFCFCVVIVLEAIIEHIE
jgi:5,10-methylene-tetrahydrofolate dehydrogenase/methenyl tetrahydrofolate cyclohydrolase